MVINFSVGIDWRESSDDSWIDLSSIPVPNHSGDEQTGLNLQKFISDVTKILEMEYVAEESLR